MRFTIYCPADTPELQLCKRFLKWQGKIAKTHIGFELTVMKKCNGGVMPVIYLDGEPFAKGFIDLVEKFKNEVGLLL